MRKVYRYESISMVLGDIGVFILSLWLSLGIRYGVFPTKDFFGLHIDAFLPLFLVWFLLYMLGGLYDRHLRFSKSKLAGKLWMAQAVSVSIAFFYFYVLHTSQIGSGLTPKTILLLYLIISSALISLWRIYLYPKISELRPLNILCIANKNDLHRFEESLLRLRQSGIKLTFLNSMKEFDDYIVQNENLKQIDIVVSNSFDEEFKEMRIKVFDLLFAGLTYMELADLHEEVFEMIPLQAINESWFLAHVSVARRYLYDGLKRSMDIIIALPLALVSLVWYPLVYIAIKIEDKGPIFIFQDRIGERGRHVRIIKFRSMKVSDGGKWVTKDDDRITKVGKVIRKTRIDELPQLWNVLRGDLSLIGPRPELPSLVELYKKEIPYYDVRHIIKPGLSGWAQIHHDVPPHSIEETKVKLAYDLYYIKNRALILDLKIAFATIKTLLSRTGI